MLDTTYHKGHCWKQLLPLSTELQLCAGSSLGHLGMNEATR